jgi:serine/threonine-protein kinase
MADEDVPVAEEFERLIGEACQAEGAGAALEELLALFAELRRGPNEGWAIARLLAAADLGRRLPEPLMVAVASALADRGEDADAARVLTGAASNAGRVLRADILARSGDVPGAVSLVERVLLRDIDWPGARERHARWRAALGATQPRPPPAPPPPWATLMTSAPDAPFRLLREVGRGGAGAVYEAEQRDLGRRVALKVYHRPERDRAQLLHEVRVAVALAGEGVVQVFDVDPESGWIAMEWVRLGPLRGLLRAGQPGLAPLGQWAAALAASLARAHRAGWVHHDVKPANVLFRDAGCPLLGDFGTARRVGEPSPPGSLGFVSPERLRGRPSDPRDDVYAFGRVLEEALDAASGIEEAMAGSRTEAEAQARETGFWGRLAAECTGADGSRPADGDALLRRIIQRRQDDRRS